MASLVSNDNSVSDTSLSLRLLVLVSSADGCAAHVDGDVKANKGDMGVGIGIMNG